MMKPLALVACAAALSCSQITNDDPNACQQTFGFGNYGCSDITGTVFSASFAPVAGVQINAGRSTDPYEPVETISNASGQFSVRLLRRWIPPTTEPDTAFTWFRTTVPASGGQPAIVDSTRVLIQFYPLGRRPTAKSVTLQTSKP
jgi:hypothetical protein